MSVDLGMSPDQRRKHLDWAAGYLVSLYAVAVEAVPEEDRERVRIELKDDPNDLLLMTLTHAGVNVMAHALRSHQCSEVCDQGVTEICPVLYLAWVIEDCPIEETTP